MAPRCRFLASVAVCLYGFSLCAVISSYAEPTAGRSTIQDTVDALLGSIGQETGAWENVPEAEADAQISDADDENSTGPSLARDRETGQLFCAWSQKDAPDGDHEIYVKTYDPVARTSAWVALANGGSGDGRISDTNRDSVSPKLLVQMTPAKRLWVIWQEGRSGGVLDQILGVDLESGFYSVLEAIKDIEYEGTYIYAKCYDLETEQWDATLDYADASAGKTISGNDDYSMASRPDAVLTAEGAPFVVWDYIRFSPEGGSGLTNIVKIIDAPNNNLGAVYGAANEEAGWLTLEGVAIDYDMAAAHALTATGQWDISVSPSVTLCADGRPSIAWVHTEVDAAGRSAADYRGLSQVHAIRYDGSAWGDTLFGGTGATDGGVSRWNTEAGVGICTQPAIAALPSGEVAVVFTRTGPENSELTGTKVIQISGKVWNPMMGQWTDYYVDDDNRGWRDLSASVFDVATGADLTVTGDGEAVVAWTDAALNVFALVWDNEDQSWDTFAKSWWLPSDINEEAGLQGGVDVICDMDQPLVAWTSASLSDTLKNTVDALANTSEITADLLTDIQTELANAVFDVRVRRFDANQVVDLTDTDLDGLPDAWETEVFGGLEQDPWMDYDNDYLTNYEEWEMGLDATDPDTDDDGYYDKAETMIPGADPDDPNVPGGGVVITGTIYDSSTGNPAASAHVSALMWGNSAPPLVSASTDDDANQDPGTYEIEIPAGVEVILVAGGPFLLPGFYDASVTPEGATPIRSFSPGDLPGIDITLGPARPVLGTLLDTADGVPLPNIPVDAFATADAAFLSRTRSRADGSYTLWVPLDTEFVIEAGGNSYVKEYHDDVALFGDALAYTLTGTDVLTSIDFSLEFNSDIAARVLGFEIEQIWVHGRPQRDLHYLLNIEVDTDESVAEVAFDTPAGNTFVIPDEVFTEEGAVSTSRWYDMGRGVYVWKHEGAFADPTELTPYGDGDYVVRVTFRDGRVQETTFPFSAPDVRAAIPQPMEAPVFLSPTQDELVTDPVTITWDAYTEDVAEALFMDLDDGDIETLAIDDTSYVAGVLGPGRHTAVLCFENGREAENADGIPYEVLKSSESTLDFVVADGADLQLELFPGWNLISLPRVTSMAVEEIFVDDTETAIKVGSLYTWSTTERGGTYVGIDGVDIPEALVGYWVFSMAGGLTRPISGVPPTGVVDLVAGWNLVGPATPVPVPDIPQLWPDVWGWDAEQTQYWRVEEEELLTPGMGYWVNALEDVSGVRLADDLEPVFSADGWDGDEARMMSDFATLQGAINEIAADEDAQDALDGALDGLGRGGARSTRALGPLAAYRTLNWNVQDRRIELSYGHSQVHGNVYITREGTVLDRYYQVDFQDNFSFFGIDIDGKLELKRRGFGLREFDLRIRRGRLAFGRHATGRRAFLLVAGVLVVKNDVFELEIPRGAGASGITGGVLGERFFQLFTSDQTVDKLAFPREWSDCPCPTSGPLGFSGRFNEVMLQFMDARQLADRLTSSGLGGTVADAFRDFVFEFSRDLDVSGVYRFTGTCTPVLEDVFAQEIHVAVNGSLNECLDAEGRDWMEAVDHVLFGIPGLEYWLRRSVRNRAEELLLERADEDGCWIVPAEHVAERVRDRLGNVIDWGTCP